MVVDVPSCGLPQGQPQLPQNVRNRVFVRCCDFVPCGLAGVLHAAAALAPHAAAAQAGGHEFEVEDLLWHETVHALFIPFGGPALEHGQPLAMAPSVAAKKAEVLVAVRSKVFSAAHNAALKAVLSGALSAVCSIAAIVALSAALLAVLHRLRSWRQRHSSSKTDKRDQQLAEPVPAAKRQRNQGSLVLRRNRSVSCSRRSKRR